MSAQPGALATSAIDSGGSRPLAIRVAGFWLRALAAAADALALAPVAAGAAALVALLLGEPIPRLDGAAALLDMALEGDPLLGGLLLVCAALALLYEFLFGWLAAGTPGMRLCRLRLITEEGEGPGGARSLWRALALAFAWALVGMGVVWIAFDRDKRGLHDHLAGTYVVRVRT